MRWWIWGLLPAFLIHDGEEVIAVLCHRGVARFGLGLDAPQFITAVLFELSLGCLLVVILIHSRGPGWSLWAFTGLTALMTFHGLAHIAYGAFSGDYVMGAATALPTCLLYGGLLLERIHSAGVISGRQMLLSCLGGLAGIWPLIALARCYGQLVA